MKTACFTGHRPNKLNGYDPKLNKALLWRIRSVIVGHIKNKGVTTFINGGALGVDLWSARIVIKLKEEFPELKIITAVPCRNHPSRWPKSSQEEYQFVLDNSDEVVLVTDDDYKPHFMQVRNEWMVDNADFIISVHDGTEGGTSNCVKYAKKKIKQITNINPKDIKS